MQRSPINSRNLHTVGYDSNTKTLEVEFKKGSIYQYYGVPFEAFWNLLGAPSAGRYFNCHIAYQFQYRCLTANYYSYRRPQRHIARLSVNEVKRLYRKLSHRFHPDKVKGFENLMKEINNQYHSGDSFGLHKDSSKIQHSMAIMPFILDWGTGNGS